MGEETLNGIGYRCDVDHIRGGGEDWGTWPSGPLLSMRGRTPSIEDNLYCKVGGIPRVPPIR